MLFYLIFFLAFFGLSFFHKYTHPNDSTTMVQLVYRVLIPLAGAEFGY